MPTQLILELPFSCYTTFSNYYNQAAQPIVELLQQVIVAGSRDRFIYLYGHPSVGCSHLLQATCYAASQQQLRCTYLPLNTLLKNHSTAILDNLETLNVIALDDLENIAGNLEWEEAFFHLYNRLLNVDTCLLLAAHRPPQQLVFTLPDLQSRLAAMLLLEVSEANDAEKTQALCTHAAERGLDLSAEVAQFLFRRTQRDMAHLCQLLDILDQASLAEQRRLTVPFVKKILHL